MQLRKASTQMMKGMGEGDGDRHAHTEKNADVGAYAAGESYCPDEWKPVTFDHPAAAGLEEKIRQRLQRLAAADLSATSQQSTHE